MLGGGGQFRLGVKDPLLLPGHGDFFLVHPLERFVAQALQVLAPGLHPVQRFAQGQQLLLVLLDRLPQLLHFAFAAQQAHAAFLGCAAGHGAAGVHHVAGQGHQPKGVPPGPHDGNAAVQVAGDHCSAQQVFHDAPVFRAVGNQFAGNPQATRHGQQPPLLRVQHAAFHAGHGQERGASQAVVAQIVDDALGRFLVLSNDVLQRAAQHHVDGGFQFLGHLHQPGHHAPDGGIPLGVGQGLSDGLVIALHLPAHFVQQPQAAYVALIFGVQVLRLFRRFLGFQGEGAQVGFALHRVVLEGVQALLHLRGLLFSGAERGGQGSLLFAALLHRLLDFGQALLHLGADGLLPGLLVFGVRQAVHGGQNVRLVAVQHGFLLLGVIQVHVQLFLLGVQLRFGLGQRFAALFGVLLALVKKRLQLRPLAQRFFLFPCDADQVFLDGVDLVGGMLPGGLHIVQVVGGGQVLLPGGGQLFFQNSNGFFQLFPLGGVFVEARFMVGKHVAEALDGLIQGGDTLFDLVVADEENVDFQIL